MKKILIFFFLFSFNNAFSQQQDSIKTPAKLTTKQKVIIGGLAVEQVLSFYTEYKWWWQNDYVPFRFGNDGMFNNYSLGVDKLGHFYTSYVSFHALNEIMQWGGFSRKTCLITSTVMPLTWALSIEMGDGFSSFGFSYPDLIANSLGISFGLLQECYPYMKNFKMKWSYYPTPFYTQNHFKGWAISDDYPGHFYWLSFDVHGLLPTPAKRYWPAFMNVAVGYGIASNPIGPHYLLRDFGISLDWNLSSIKTKNKSLHAVKEIMDYIHYPAPGLHKVEGQQVEYKGILFR